MIVIEATKKKLNSVVSIVNDLELSEFPHSDAQYVLVQIKNILERRLNSLGKLKAHTHISTVNNLCKECIHTLFTIYPLLGFILRSTNVRNAFELHGPLLRIVRRGFCSGDSKLVISSEWEFSPFIDLYPSNLGLDNVVFIGMPASEASNCLSIPLTGHEFGHNLWTKYDLGAFFEQTIEEKIVKHIESDIWDDFTNIFGEIDDKSSLKDILGRQYWRQSWLWSLRQCEELFCDFVGLLLFREAYLYAFSYLLSPGLAGQRSRNYPNICARVNSLLTVSNTFNIEIPDGYLDRFEDSVVSGGPEEKLLLEISDYVTSLLISDLSDKAYRIFIDTDLDDECKSAEIDKTKHCFGIGVPIMDKASLSSIVNAAWIFYNEGMEEWKERYPLIYSDEDKKNEMLNDLVYKSIEVLEIFELQRYG